MYGNRREHAIKQEKEAKQGMNKKKTTRRHKKMMIINKHAQEPKKLFSDHKLVSLAFKERFLCLIILKWHVFRGH